MNTYNPHRYIDIAAKPLFKQRERWMSPHMTKHLGGLSAESAIALLREAERLIRKDSETGDDDPEALKFFDGGTIFQENT